MSIVFKGEAYTRWSIEETRTTDDNKQENETIDLTGSEEYFKIKYYLLGGSGAINNCVLLSSC